MKEELVGTITAKLAKEKGFNIECPVVRVHKPFSPSDPCYVPTQSLLQKWLREEYNIHITIFSSSQESWMYRITKPHQGLIEGLYGEDFTTYEDALEHALQEALKLIKL